MSREAMWVPDSWSEERADIAYEDYEFDRSIGAFDSSRDEEVEHEKD